MTTSTFPATVLRNVRVFDGATLGRPTCVLIDGGLIAAVDDDIDTAAGQPIDGQERALFPGFIDAHVHLHGPENLTQLARAGVTTALDMACWPRELVDDLRHRPGLTDIRSAGVPATSPGSRHSAMPGRPEASLLNGPDDAKRFVDDRLAEGSDYIKLIADVPGPDQATLDAVVAAAHDHGVLTVAHAVASVPYRMALAAAADVITHAPLDAVLDDATISGLAEKGTVTVPTLTMMDAVAAKIFGIGADSPGAAATGPAPGYAKARESVRRLAAAGVPILAGTDANATVGVPANVPHGASLHRELQLLVAAGLSPLQAITAATSLPARHFRLPDRGTIRPGLRADLVLLDGDPLSDITASGRIDQVWCGGVEVVR